MLCSLDLCGGCFRGCFSYSVWCLYRYLFVCVWLLCPCAHLCGICSVLPALPSAQSGGRLVHSSVPLAPQYTLLSLQHSIMYSASMHNIWWCVHWPTANSIYSFVVLLLFCMLATRRHNSIEQRAYVKILALQQHTNAHKCKGVPCIECIACVSSYLTAAVLVWPECVREVEYFRGAGCYREKRIRFEVHIYYYTKHIRFLIISLQPSLFTDWIWRDRHIVFAWPGTLCKKTWIVHAYNWLFIVYVYSCNCSLYGQHGIWLWRARDRHNFVSACCADSVHSRPGGGVRYIDFTPNTHRRLICELRECRDFNAQRITWTHRSLCRWFTGIVKHDDIWIHMMGALYHVTFCRSGQTDANKYWITLVVNALCTGDKRRWVQSSRDIYYISFYMLVLYGDMSQAHKMRSLHVVCIRHVFGVFLNLSMSLFFLVRINSQCEWRSRFGWDKVGTQMICNLKQHTES